MAEPEIPLVPARRVGSDSHARVRVRVGETVRRSGYPWSPAVLDLLRRVEREVSRARHERWVLTSKAERY